MKQASSELIPLSALSAAQRRKVESNLPLVHCTLRRLTRTCTPGYRRHEYREMQQEGALALIEALLSYEPRRHGYFAAYAMARIRFAVSRFLHEHGRLIRVPYATQRRRKAAALLRNSAAPIFKQIPFETANPKPCRTRRLRWYGTISAESSRLDDPRRTLGELLRECLDRHAARVLAAMKRSSRISGESRRLFDLCARERWLVPEPQARTPLRELIKRGGCSMGKLTRSETRFRRMLADALEADPDFRRLRQLARSRPDGYRSSVEPDLEPEPAADRRPDLPRPSSRTSRCRPPSMQPKNNNSGIE